jgi:hypothetical protein
MVGPIYAIIKSLRKPTGFPNKSLALKYGI